MIDIHSHILPNFDDGARDTDTALEMLRISASQGVDTVVSTSHCYPRDGLSIEHFIDRRADRLERLKTAMREDGGDFPRLISGCELNLMSDVSAYDRLEELCVGDTNYILLEMPYEPWTEDVLDIVYKVTLRGLVPVMAHIDRFLYQKKSLVDSLFGLDVLFQLNAEAFLDKKSRKQTAELLERDAVYFIGSDMHNVSSRPPQMADARNAVIRDFGESYWNYLENNNERLIAGESFNSVLYKKPERKGLFERIFHKQQ